MKIVIVEDELALSTALYDKFKRVGFDAYIARDGEEAMDVVKKVQPDIIALDLLLPKKNGFDVLSDLKADSELKDIPVIVLSNLDQDEDLKRCLKLGAVEYWVKNQHPINEVVEKVKMILLEKSK